LTELFCPLCCYAEKCVLQDSVFRDNETLNWPFSDRKDGDGGFGERERPLFSRGSEKGLKGDVTAAFKENNVVRIGWLLKEPEWKGILELVPSGYFHMDDNEYRCGFCLMLITVFVLKKVSPLH